MPRKKPDITTQSFWLTSLGCKVNQYDGNAVAKLLHDRRWHLASSPESAGLLVINTCCITTTAMRKSRQTVAKAIRRSPDAAVIVIGCYSDYDGERLTRLVGSFGLLPNRFAVFGHHDDLPARIGLFIDSISTKGSSALAALFPAAASQPDGNRYDLSMSVSGQASGPVTSLNPTSIKARRNAAVKRIVSTSNTLRRIDRFAGHSRAFVKVQDGCDAMCSYCIVPYTRARVWSKTIQEIEQECRELVNAGHREIVLCGVFLGAFGQRTAVRRKWEKPTSHPLAELVSRVAEMDGLWRVRLSSLSPGDVTDELLEVCSRLSRFAPHLHLPLQSGSGRILKRMNRQYSAQDYLDAAERIKKAFDRPAITTDIIVGFPGELDEDFTETLEVARRCGFAKIHAFPFSPIEPTPAWTWRREMPSRQVVAARMSELRRLERQLARQYRRQFVGQTMEALVEGNNNHPDQGRFAMTDRYFRANFETCDDLSTGKVVELLIAEASSNHVSADLVNTRARATAEQA